MGEGNNFSLFVSPQEGAQSPDSFPGLWSRLGLGYPPDWDFVPPAGTSVTWSNYHPLYPDTSPFLTVQIYPTLEP